MAARPVAVYTVVTGGHIHDPAILFNNPGADTLFVRAEDDAVMVTKKGTWAKIDGEIVQYPGSVVVGNVVENVIAQVEKVVGRQH